MKPFVRIVELGAAFLCSNLARAAIGFGLTLAIGRGLGADRFGIWILCTTWASTLTTLADLGFGVLLTRDGARGDADPVRLLTGALALRLVVAIPLGIALAIGAGALSSNAETIAALRVAGLLGLSGAAYGCFGALFRSQPRWLPTVLAVETAWLAVQLASAWALVHGGRGVVALIALATSVQLAQIATALAMWRFVFGEHAKPENENENENQNPNVNQNPEPRTLNPEPRHLHLTLMLRRALPFAATGLVANLQLRVAPLMLGALATPAELGWFGAASRVGRAVRLAPQAILGGALPVLSREYAVDRSGAHAVSHALDRALNALSLCGAIALVLLAAPLMRLLFGAPFAAAGPALIWAAIGLVPAVSNSSRKVFLFAAGREALVLRWTTVALMIQVVSAGALIPVFGAAGAAASVAIGEAAIWWPLRRADVTEVRLKPDATYVVSGFSRT